MQINMNPQAFTARMPKLSKAEANNIIKKNWTHPYYKQLPIQQENFLIKTLKTMKNFIFKK